MYFRLNFLLICLFSAVPRGTCDIVLSKTVRRVGKKHSFPAFSSVWEKWIYVCRFSYMQCSDCLIADNMGEMLMMIHVLYRLFMWQMCLYLVKNKMNSLNKLFRVFIINYVRWAFTKHTETFLNFFFQIDTWSKTQKELTYILGNYLVICFFLSQREKFQMKISSS